MSLRTAAKSPSALIIEDSVRLGRSVKSSKEVRRYRTSESDTQACGKGVLLSPIIDGVHARRHVAEPRRSRQTPGGWQNHEGGDSGRGGHDLGPHKIVVGNLAKSSSALEFNWMPRSARVTGTGLAAFAR